MKRLYEVQLPDAVWHFDTKEAAKTVRDEYNLKHKGFLAHVSLGPDHRDYGVKKHPTTHHNRMVGKGKRK